ncbi:MAG: hypothetical protein P4L84_33750 [Isosphaeraceae bacterium]|nr:hypothetical protein [Isosphaeraceae bacterium]
MRRRETLYERNLKRPLDRSLRDAINREAAERCRHIHFPTEHGWEEKEAVFTIRSSLATFFATFSADKLVVSAELSLAARLFATEHNRKHAVEIIASIADQLDL